MALIDLADPLFNYLTAQNLRLRGRSGSFGAGLDGRYQVVEQENRMWVAELRFGHLGTQERILLSRSTGTRLNGMANVLRFRVSNLGTLIFTGDLPAFYAEVGYTAAQIAEGFVRFSDDTTFTDGTGFALASADEPATTAAASEGESTISLVGVIGERMEIGARFSIDDFLYEVTANDAGNVQFAPPLRSNVPAGTTVNVSEPYIRMRLMEDDGWTPFTDYGLLNSPMTVSLMEAFER